MAVTNYHTLDGEIIAETTGGVRTDYLTDALGSVVATVNQSAQVVNTYRYKPYGAQLAKTGIGADPAFRWVGQQGYKQTDKKWSDVYVRARHASTTIAEWISKDLLRDVERPFAYILVDQNPTNKIDPSGLAVKIEGCRPTDYAIIDSLIRQMCRHFRKAESQSPGWQGVTDCVNRCTLPSKPGFGPHQKDCMLQWCRTGRVVCDYGKICVCDVVEEAPGGVGPPWVGEACACHQKHSLLGREEITICNAHAMPGGVWDAKGCGCGNYVACGAKQCQGREGFFTIIHEMMHHCGTASDQNADVKTCCILENLFDVIWPPNKCERGCPVRPNVVSNPGLIWTT